MKSVNAQLLIIDPQNDFMGEDDGSPYTEKLANGTAYTAALPVTGATSDMRRLAAMIRRIGHKLTDIHGTLDSHHTMHIAHGDMWRDANGKPPAPYTEISAADVGVTWFARNPAHQQRFKAYCQALESVPGKYKHRIWAPHCRIGTWGHNVFPELEAALAEWERKNMGVVNYVTKGSEVWSEHFGALMAQVPDPDDPSTQLNAGFVKLLEEPDVLAVAGEALDFCEKTTLEQILEQLGEASAKKIVLLTDCSSAIFPDAGKQFLADMKARGVQLMKSTEFLA